MDIISVTKTCQFPFQGSVLVSFDRVMRSKNASVSGIKLLVNDSPVVYNILRSTFHGKKIKINEFHKILEQGSSDTLKNTANSNKFG
jgi:hypothetical protein